MTSSGFPVTIAPPSSEVMILTGPKLKQVRSPKVPIGRPPCVEPKACAASSTTRSPCSRGELVDRVQAGGRDARVVEDEDRPRALAEHAAQRVRRDAERLLLDVAEDDVGAGRRDGLVARHVRQRRADDLVAGPDAGEDEGGVERGGAAAHRHQRPRLEAEVGRELVLEEGRLPAHPEPARLERLGCGPLHLGPEIGPKDGEDASVLGRRRPNAVPEQLVVHPRSLYQNCR